MELFLSRSTLLTSFGAFLAVHCCISPPIALAADSGLPKTPNQPAQTAPPTPQTPTPTQNPEPPTGGTTASDNDFLKSTASTLDIDQSPFKKAENQFFSWGGLRPYLASEYGLTFQPSLTADYSSNFRGGANTAGDIFRTLFDFRISLDTQPLFKIKGGTFSIDFQNQTGRNGSDDVGDVQGFDNADADGRTQISELWYEQYFLKNKMRIKVGKVDANTEFAAPEYSSQFLNSSFGYSPSITNFPTYPDGALSFNVFVYPAPWLYAGYGVYDGDGVGNHPITTAFNSPTDYFQIAEVGVRWTLREGTLPGRLAGGVFYDNAAFETFSGRHQSGTAGAYFIAEQKLLHQNFYTKDDERGVYAFAQYSFGDAEVNDVRQHLGAGLTWVGPYAKANNDTVGIGFTTAFLSDASGTPCTQDTETSIEGFYNFQATSYLSIKPDLQYIIHPGGNDAQDALVATLRVTVAF